MTAPLPPFPSALNLRAAQPRDEHFLLELYGTVRAPDLALLPWTAAQKRAFVADQYRLQQDHYRHHCPTADFWVIEHEAHGAIGRLSLDRTGPEWRLIEIALLPHARGAGTGGRLVAWVQQASVAAAASAVTLHVELRNRAAWQWYVRMGFRDAPSRFPTHRFLRWPTAPEPRNT
ncbi:GNAT family N-acetyltransferase [Sphingomonas sp. R1]|uniref:GNAT family N-acetyltransferase n=1 Tax=Sphingomonas sp. R1 TaxID=399176 RepID=UPI0022241842|nr:GNAT family N-acetyltransferase [Sphingomonas sp. R1]UYY77081.1 GNAT family N-acetyltransferase [Sphingomonas sp. R1]